ncbi:Pycsar system effector family protein [Paracnuella aquatica]|uniref:Pycsar system effector family protein n=1 Tax=Paracnuella aquatica TaxID=2268757 RepID=UPI000DEF1ADD|nr:Pycsar system effector family protein [Paracnuella aquatica]RPD46071.1 HD domain-containing protein [Paracnuella aquatica]
MSETNELLLSAARDFVTDLYQHRVRPQFVFHSLEHTEDVVEACSYMADYHKLEADDRLVLMLAAWFHDTGYIKGEATGHEAESVRIAQDFLAGQEADPIIQQRVGSCIQATRMPQSPVSLVEKILCDADLYHLSTQDFKARSQLLKQEQEALLGRKISGKEWRKNNITFLETHRYFTDYGKEHLEPQKAANLQSLHKKGGKADKAEPESKPEPPVFPYTQAAAITDPELAKAEQKTTERGVQTMFRTTSNNHFELSSLADGKANIMISVNAIIISVVLTVLLVRIPYYKQYIIPTAMLAITCLSAMIFAILSTRPSVSSGRFTEEDIRSKRANLLFFGNFFRMQLEEYQWGMNEMLKDREYLYNSMIKDIYFLGVVLARKYRFLRIAYTIFMWGLIASVVAFAVAALYGASNPNISSSAPLIDY